MQLLAIMNNTDWMECSIKIDEMISSLGLYGKYTPKAVVAALDYIAVAHSWKEAFQPSDMQHGFLVSPVHAELFDHCEIQANSPAPPIPYFLQAHDDSWSANFGG